MFLIFRTAQHIIYVSKVFVHSRTKLVSHTFLSLSLSLSLLPSPHSLELFLFRAFSVSLLLSIGLSLHSCFSLFFSVVYSFVFILLYLSNFAHYLDLLNFFLSKRCHLSTRHFLSIFRASFITTNCFNINNSQIFD